MDREKIQNFVKSAWENITWEIIASAGVSLISTLYVAFKSQFSDWFAKMNLATPIAITAMLIGFGVVAWAIFVFAFRIFEKITHRTNDEDFVVYDDLTLEKDPNLASFLQSAMLTAGFSDEFKLSAIVSNGNKTVYECLVVLDNFEYCHSGQYSGWAHSNFDRKAMKWDVGYMPNEGKIELEYNAKKVLEIARYERNEGLQLSHLDGYSERRNISAGKYRATFRIDGKIAINKFKKPIRTVRYTVTFEYNPPSLKITEIKRD